MILLKLFYEFFKTGLFAVGGGMATLPFLYSMSDKYPAWFSHAQLADMIAVSESTPGPIGVNMATYVGFTTAGIPGAVAATLGLVTPSVIIILLIARVLQAFRQNKYVDAAFYGLRPCSVGLIAAAGVSIIALSFWGGGLGNFSFAGLDYIAIGIFAVAFFVLQKWKPNPIYVMLGCGVLGLALYSFL